MSSYASLSDLVTYGLPATAFGTVTDPQKQAALDAASAYIDSKLRGRYGLPLQAWGIEITRCAVKIALADILELRGWDPTNAGDAAVMEAAKAEKVWLDQVQRSAAHPNVTPADTQPGTYGPPKVLTSSAVATNSNRTDTTRGW